ncbi:uncharacterized protein BCR38DRAFT_487599 [Pseudomassariella vexata]|uniref:Nucleoporin NUP53 n=1 Tax=Pseudomassariella vexata TaxID=1141098 RepID=A0A1Y2DMZ2_9PEZI|nr:uncharacterized protein BCR38DRAFT_487599 [Pseudomassariella vexata]ORY60539.1 hypothetical protein BCR38DRAFT_487599 [Pseudomassariella vexata]
MRPLILHNVPDDELYTGEDGVQRPYAMIFPEADRQRDSPRRRAVAESGSFGKSTRRSRSRTGTPVPKRNEDATMQSADKIFSDYISNQQSLPITTGNGQRKPSYLSQTTNADDGASASQAPRFVQEPTEVILRGYRSASQQYAAINHYEQLAGRICEDYPRDPPSGQRRYKSELRDPAFTRRHPLTPQERAKVNQIDGGEHWIKVTFESADAADAAIFASPQKILGHLVYAEPYRGMPPKEDAAVAEMLGEVGMMQDAQPNPRAQSQRHSRQKPSTSSFQPKEKGTVIPSDWSTPLISGGSKADLGFNGSPPESQTSTQTIDSATMSSSTGTASTATVTGSQILRPIIAPEGRAESELDSTYCRRIPQARRVKLKPAEQALLPQPGVVSRIISRIPLIKWFGGSMIGNEVPRTENGEFDFTKASLYWQLMFYLDYWFGLFGHEIVSADKDD